MGAGVAVGTGTPVGAEAAAGTAGAYVGLIARSRDDLDSLTSIPLLHLAAMVLGVPAVAATAASLLARREPSGLASQAVE